MTWHQVNDDKIFILGWSSPLWKKRGFVEAHWVSLVCWQRVNEQIETNSLFWATYSPRLVKEWGWLKLTFYIFRRASSCILHATVPWTIVSYSYYYGYYGKFYKVQYNLDGSICWSHCIWDKTYVNCTLLVLL